MDFGMKQNCFICDMCHLRTLFLFYNFEDFFFEGIFEDIVVRINFHNLIINLYIEITVLGAYNLELNIERMIYIKADYQEFEYTYLDPYL